MGACFRYWCLPMAQVTPAPLNLWIGRHTPTTHASTGIRHPSSTLCQAIWSRTNSLRIAPERTSAKLPIARPRDSTLRLMASNLPWLSSENSPCSSVIASGSVPAGGNRLEVRSPVVVLLTEMTALPRVRSWHLPHAPGWSGWAGYWWRAVLEHGLECPVEWVHLVEERGDVSGRDYQHLKDQIRG